MLKDELKTVEMIKQMTRNDKIRLNQMVQSVLHHQQNNEMKEINVTTAKRQVVQLQKQVVAQEADNLKYQIELSKVNKEYQEAKRHHQMLQKTLISYQKAEKAMVRKFEGIHSEKPKAAGSDEQENRQTSVEKNAN